MPGSVSLLHSPAPNCCVQVVSHLMITSALLLAVACGLLLWAASRSGRPSRSHMTLLPTEEEEDF